MAMVAAEEGVVPTFAGAATGNRKVAPVMVRQPRRGGMAADASCPDACPEASPEWQAIVP